MAKRKEKESGSKILRVFTDGACSNNPGPGGYAIIFCLNENIEKESGYEVYTTNNRMELMAVIKAISIYMKKYIDTYGTIEINSDSAYVVDAINKGWIAKWKKNGWITASGGAVKNKELWQKLENVISIAKDKGGDVILIKVKGHDGEHLNEMADELAVAASKKAIEELEQEEDF